MIKNLYFFLKSPTLLDKKELDIIRLDLCKQIHDWVGDDSVHVVAILNGAKNISDYFVAYCEDNNIECQVEYIKIKASDRLELLENKVLESTFKQKSYDTKTLILDDLIDSGGSIDMAYDIIKSVDKKTYIRKATLFNKYDTNKHKVDFLGYNFGFSLEYYKERNIKDIWFFGYGMDLDGYFRNIDYIKGLYIQK